LIAELGINHSGSLEEARDLIFGAKSIGVHAVKFQYRNLDRAYSTHKNEIGDSIVSSEITRNFLTTDKILELTKFAQSLDLSVGISFFTCEDVKDFSITMENFDFYKIPSPELTNLSLIYELLSFQKYVLISTGAHNEEEIEKVFKKLPNTGWSPMHCVSNYPTLGINAKLGYIKYLSRKWNMPVGYSSHDEEWVNIIGAIALGAQIIERHITKSKDALGLDHSSSSTIEEFSKISKFALDSKFIFSGNSPRIANQGELINLQNLGRTFYSKREIKRGEILSERDFDYRSPRIGLGFQEFQSLSGSLIIEKIKKGEAVTPYHLTRVKQISKNVILFAKQYKIAIPVRVHDYLKIKKELPTGFYEFHLSYKEVEELRDLLFIDSSDNVSIHLPDYVNSNFLLDPFSSNAEQRVASLALVNKISSLVNSYQKKYGKKIIVVGSFSSNMGSNDDFYDNCANLSSEMLSKEITLCFQWLPPYAWYFGGSKKITVFNQEKDCLEISKRKLLMCLDTSHLILGANFFGFDSAKILSLLKDNIVHAHISDGVGVDGEGMQFGSSSKSNSDLILNLMDQDVTKVIEVWQGHSNNLSGFKKGLIKLKRLYEAR
jgi:sialic acid synthase SpsE